MSKHSIKLIQGDITKLEVDAIVNAANKTLRGGGGVDGAIHRAAGRDLLLECIELRGAKTGEAKITDGYKLPARHVIHTVGPVWEDGQSNEPELLAAAYRNSLQVAVDNGLKTIAFPNISTGVYGFPKKQAAEIAIQTVKDFMANNATIETVYFVLFDKENRKIYEELLATEGIVVKKN